jgi:hypothetical protein
MKTAESIERQESRKEDEKRVKTPHFSSQNSGPVSGRRGRVENLKPWSKVSVGIPAVGRT